MKAKGKPPKNIIHKSTDGNNNSFTIFFFFSLKAKSICNRAYTISTTFFNTDLTEQYA